MRFNKVIINATPDSLHVYDEDGTRLVLVLPRDENDPIARAGERTVRLSDADISGVKIAIYGAAYTQLTGLPEPQDGVVYVVALPPAILATDRDDLLVCGPAVRDDKGRMIGCKGLSVPHHPVAAHPEPRRFHTKEDLGRLYVQGPDQFPWATYTPYGLAGVLFARGLISKEEIDLAQRDFGPAWMAHTDPVRADPTSTLNLAELTNSDEFAAADHKQKRELVLTYLHEHTTAEQRGRIKGLSAVQESEIAAMTNRGLEAFPTVYSAIGWTAEGDIIVSWNRTTIFVIVGRTPGPDGEAVHEKLSPEDVLARTAFFEVSDEWVNELKERVGVRA